MAANKILPFSPNDIGTNLLTDAAYAAAANRSNGNQPGIASSKLNNKAIKQGTLMAAALAQFLADNQATDLVDTLTPAQIAAIIASVFKGRIINYQFISASGTYTPTAGATAARVCGQGGGGAGGGAAATAAGQVSVGLGGVAGAYGELWIPTALAAQVVVIGAGGTPVSGAAGGAGAATTFGALLVCPGGTGGPTSAAAVPPYVVSNQQQGNAVTGTGAIIVRSTALGAQDKGIVLATGAGGFASGAGASSVWGSGGLAQLAAANGAAGVGYGSGGGGAANGPSLGAKTGGAGVTGGMLIEEYA